MFLTPLSADSNSHASFQYVTGSHALRYVFTGPKAYEEHEEVVARQREMFQEQAAQSNSIMKRPTISLFGATD